MLLRLSEEICECYMRAAQARMYANYAHDPKVKQDFLDMERRWLNLARSYEFTERLSNFTGEADRRIR